MYKKCIPTFKNTFSNQAKTSSNRDASPSSVFHLKKAAYAKL